MTEPAFSYRTILKSDESGLITSIVVHRVQVTGPLEAILWSVPRKAWIYAPALAVRFLFDDQYRERTQSLDRTTAGRIAHDVLETELPSEETLQAMCEEGKRMGWDYGPPRGGGG
ncbi:hypothetical protein Ahu01nite_032310 [Winogradskya humida]|uniref:GLPGLI family protein n=1 Tax=Winogradskya humida TaxID=113566 RepID=A0ABQ3ZNQ8_9ACTN|nr:hypothetical protein Ahu01nite_032310 [Actinoplanes humidus]